MPAKDSYAGPDSLSASGMSKFLSLAFPNELLFKFGKTSTICSYFPKPVNIYRKVFVFMFTLLQGDIAIMMKRILKQLIIVCKDCETGLNAHFNRLILRLFTKWVSRL